jgi:hypothetical protein
MAKFIYFQPANNIFQKFENYEIWPCRIIENNNSGNIIYEQCGFDDPDIAIWCVYGHFLADRYLGGLECISDHETLKEAEEFTGTLPILPITPSTPR